MDNVTSLINSTSSLLNGTTTRRPTPLPATPPPVGYYGETKEMLWKVIPPIIMIWGTVGNILIFVVLLRQKTKISSTAMYLMALAISDTMILYCGPLRQWVKYIWEYDIRFQTEASCKIQVFITYASVHCSSWLLVAVTLERAISVVFPHKVRIVSTKKTAMMVIFSIFVFTYGLNIVHLVIMSTEAYRTNSACAPKTKEYLDFRDNIFTWIDFCVVFAVPFVFLVIGNVSIIVCLQRSRSKQKLMTASRGQSGSSSARDTRSVSVLMIILCIIFLLTTTPVSIFNAVMPYKFEQINQLFKTEPYKAWYDYQYLLFQHAIVNLVGYTNASFNFILYVFSGSKFRRELMAMFKCKGAIAPGLFSSKSKTSSSKTKTTSVSATKLSQFKYTEKQIPSESFDKRNNHVQQNLDNFHSVAQNDNVDSIIQSDNFNSVVPSDNKDSVVSNGNIESVVSNGNIKYDVSNGNIESVVSNGNSDAIDSNENIESVVLNGNIESVVSNANIESVVSIGNIESDVSNGNSDSDVLNGNIESVVSNGNIEFAVSNGNIESDVSNGNSDSVVSNGNI